MKKLKKVKLHHIKKYTYGKCVHKRHYWIYKCVCGKQFVADKAKIKSGNTKSCGCFRREIGKIKGKLFKKHGMSFSRIYKIWYGMKSRCNNPKEPHYYNYGGKGVKIIWKTFEDFRDDMYEPYLKHTKQFGEKNTTIDRINNNGNYCKENCRWATYNIQALNRWGSKTQLERKSIMKKVRSYQS